MALERALGRGAFALVAAVALAGLVSLWWRPAQSMPDAVRIPIVKTHPEGAPQAAARFRHGRHDQFTCAACHPAMFPQWRVGFTHQDMNEGRFCGQCHDGSAGFALAEAACETCHVPK